MLNQKNRYQTNTNIKKARITVIIQRNFTSDQRLLPGTKGHFITIKGSINQRGKRKL